jgi:hypothetical protein
MTGVSTNNERCGLSGNTPDLTPSADVRSALLLLANLRFVVNRAEMALGGQNAVVMMVAVISALDGVMADGAMGHFAHVLGIFADAVLNGVPDLAERVAVVLVLGQSG